MVYAYAAVGLVDHKICRVIEDLQRFFFFFQNPRDSYKLSIGGQKVGVAGVIPPWKEKPCASVWLLEASWLVLYWLVVKAGWFGLNRGT